MKKRDYLWALLILLVPLPLLADPGVPMIFVTLPGMLLALLPIIAIESWMAKKSLGTSTFRTVKVVGTANLASTLLGIPLTWFLLVLVQLLTGGGEAHDLRSPMEKALGFIWQSPWLLPDEANLYWMIPAATMVLLVPFFFASCGVEYLVFRVWLDKDEVPRSRLRSIVVKANLASYVVLFLLAAAWLITARPPR